MAERSSARGGNDSPAEKEVKSVFRAPSRSREEDLRWLVGSRHENILTLVREHRALGDINDPSIRALQLDSIQELLQGIRRNLLEEIDITKYYAIENNTGIAGEESTRYTDNDLGTNDDLRETTELHPAHAEKDFEPMPGDFGPTKKEILQLTDSQLAEALARRFRTSVDDANTLVGAMQLNASAMIEAGKKLLKPKSRFYTRSDFSEDELNDPTKIGEAKQTVYLHRRDRIGDLDDKTADELRRASALLRYNKYQPRAKTDTASP